MGSELDELRCKMEVCTACSLHESRDKLVFGVGKTKNPVIMVLGEGPGEEESKTGLPFIGKCGAKLDKIFKYIGVTRDEIYIANAVCCRPPNNRVPLMEELDACRWRLHLQIKLIQPQLLVILGKSAMTTMLGQSFTGPLSQFFEDNWLEFNIDGQTFKGICSYHPSFHLRSPDFSYKATLPHWTKVKHFIEAARNSADSL